MQSHDLFYRNPDVILRPEEPHGALLYNPDTDQVRMVNATGLFIWKLCDGRHDLPAIIAEIKEAFSNIPAHEVEAEVAAYITDLQRNGFIGLAAGDGKK